MTGPRGDIGYDFVPIGEKIDYIEVRDEWVKTETPGIERNIKDGRLRTNFPDPLPTFPQRFP